MKEEVNLLIKVLLYCIIIIFRKQTLEEVNHI